MLTGGLAGRHLDCAAPKQATAVCSTSYSTSASFNTLRHGQNSRRQPRRSTRNNNNNSRLLIKALDAAMPFDFEARARQDLAERGKLSIGIVGFGTFGQFLARRLVAAGHTVLATSRSPYEDVADAMGVAYFRDSNDFCEQHPDVVILASSILSLEQVLERLPVQRLRRSTLFVDVLSVKEFPKRLLLARLPAETDILCCHPMYGPDSGKGSWEGLNFMYDKVRIGPSEHRQARCATFLQFFENEGCNMVEMTCEEHDRAAASTQFITHTVGRMLGAMELEKTKIDTKGFQSLLNLVENTNNDSFELYYGLFMYNQNATQELDRLERAFDEIKKQLFTKLHDRVRSQLFLEDGRGGGGGNSNAQPHANGNGVAATVANGSSKQSNGTATAAANGTTPATKEVRASVQSDAKN